MKASTIASSFFIFAATLLLAGAGIAQTQTNVAPERPPGFGPGGVNWQAAATFSYDAPGATRFQGTHLARSDAYTANVGVSGQLTLDEKWFVRLGIRSDNYFLDAVSGAPIPDGMHTLRFNTGLGYHYNDQWTLTGLFSPALYRFMNVGGDEIGFSGGVLAAYQASPDWLWTFGILISPDSDVPVLPVVGLRWRINADYSLEVGVPNTRLIYQLAPQWSLYTGLDLTGTTFRTAADLGAKAGFPQYGNTLATYRTIRLGVGVTGRLVAGWRTELEAGYSVYRQINYTDLNQSVDFDPAPYVRLGLSCRF